LLATPLVNAQQTRIDRLIEELQKLVAGRTEMQDAVRILTEAQIKDLLDPVKLSGLDKSKYQKQ
jgi:hypothetical protein